VLGMAPGGAVESKLGSNPSVPTENSGGPSKVSSTSQVTMLHALVLLKPQLNFDTDVADSLAPRLR
jgi:hypothetical protein